MTGPITRIPRPLRADAQPAGAGLTHVGRVRQSNEDAILTDPAGALWAVADGMGGYGHGDIAADIVIDRLSRLPHGAASPALLVAALEAANLETLRRAAAEGIAQMGATVVAALITGGKVVIAWVGDSRAYGMNGGRLSLLTHDHSLVQELIDRGKLSAAEAEGHPQAHVVTRAIGAAERVEVAVTEVPFEPGDLVMLCSDGLIRCVSEAEIAAVLASNAEPEAACRELVEAALRRGAPDNVSVVVVRAGEAGPR